jgi:hypothetical protein
MAGSGVIALICFVAYTWSEPEEEYPPAQDDKPETKSPLSD